MSKDYDTEIIDGTVSTARAGFEDCTKLGKFRHKKDLGPGGGNEKQKHKFEKKPLRERTVLFYSRSIARVVDTVGSK